MRLTPTDAVVYCQHRLGRVHSAKESPSCCIMLSFRREFRAPKERHLEFQDRALHWRVLQSPTALETTEITRQLTSLCV